MTTAENKRDKAAFVLTNKHREYMSQDVEGTVDFLVWSRVYDRVWHRVKICIPVNEVIYGHPR